ncbi:MAG: hypothetical protein JKX70_11610 [Phycisphaerales bacterium]|nr:hypothetical protein [Phycisphaerales bacterium]
MKKIALFSVIALSALMVGCSSTETRDYDSEACDTAAKEACATEAKAAACPTEGMKKMDCADDMKKMDCGKDCTKPCCAE